MRESLCNQVIVWVNSTLYHIDTMTIFPRYQGSIIDMNGVKNKNIVKYSHPTGIKKKCEFLIIDTLMVF